MVLVGLYALLRTISVVASPLLPCGFIDYSNQKSRELRQDVVLIVSLVANKVVESLSQRHCFFDSRRYGMRMRSGLMALVYGKLLKLSITGRRNHSTGEIVNYIAVDAYRLGEFPWWFHLGSTLPLQMILTVAVLLRAAGLEAALRFIPLIILALIYELSDGEDPSEMSIPFHGHPRRETPVYVKNPQQHEDHQDVGNLT